MVGDWTAKLLAYKCTLGADMLYTLHIDTIRDSFYTSSIAEKYARPYPVIRTLHGQFDIKF